MNLKPFLEPRNAFTQEKEACLQLLVLGKRLLGPRGPLSMGLGKVGRSKLQLLTADLCCYLIY